MKPTHFAAASTAFLFALLPVPSGAAGKNEKILYGRVAKEINQHLVAGVKGKQAVYFDVDGGDQIVVYVAGNLDCPGRVELTGRMTEAKGPEKRPGKPSKVDDSYSEPQMDVARWRCLDGRIEGLIDALADPKLSVDRKGELKKEIVKGGKDAIPVLIGHLGDARVVRREDVQNYQNMPVTQPPPPKIMADVTVGDECERMLYDIITPDDVPASADLTQKPFSVSILSVPDWKSWWEKNRDKSLERIHGELKPLVDRYWRERGTEQVVR